MVNQSRADGRPAPSPLLVREIDEVRQQIARLRAAGQRVGLVPTMGALHAGHLSLVEASQRECDATVVTIFVNPTQFGPKEDFDRYPRDLNADMAMLSPLGVRIIYAPSVEAMYGPRHATYVEVAGVAETLEGAFRPGHFRGVATIVAKLFNVTAPDVAYFGQKDFQQTLVVRRLVEDLNLPLEIRVCPTVREPDGLALSSRNAYLSADARQRALALSRALALARDLVARGETKPQLVRAKMRELLDATPGLQVEYAVVADPHTLAELQEFNGQAVALIAARVDGVRLIDNQLLEPVPAPAGQAARHGPRVKTS